MTATSHSDELYRLLVASIRDYAIFILSPTGHVQTWNAGAQAIKGYAPHEIVGSHFSRFYPASDVAAGKCEYELEVATKVGRFEDVGWRVRKDGTQFWANVVITAVRTEAGELVGFSKVTRDLTEQKRSEDDRAARLVAEQAARAKDEFLAMLGHELRNPLAPIVTALQLIKLRGGAKSSKEHDIIERQVTHMARLVDDLLDVSRIARGKVELKRRHIDLRDVVAQAVEIASPLFDNNHHQLTVHSPASTLMVDGDEGRLVQVVTNLLTNAARYTDPAGKIDVIVEQRGDTIAVEVTDTGIGISAALLPRVFDMFEQGVQGADRSTGGLGLGLSLVRSLTKLHGGEATAHSGGLGAGSTFTITIPALTGPTPSEDKASGPTILPNGTRKRRVLIVDDNEDARMLLAELIAATGHEVADAGDGPDALAKVVAFAPEIAILDIGLPGMDGYELLARLADVLPERPRFIALSGYGQKTDLERSKASGFDLHLVKPVDIRRLLDSLT